MEEMSDEEIERMVGGSWFGHLALADKGRAYAMPIFFGFLDSAFYFHSHPGYKDAYFETTEEACLTITRVASEDRWASVIVQGTIDEVALEDERARAMDALMGVPLPPSMGETPSGEPKRGGGGELTFRKLTPRKITGRKSEPPPPTASEAETLGG